MHYSFLLGVQPYTAHSFQDCHQHCCRFQNTIFTEIQTGGVMKVKPLKEEEKPRSEDRSTLWRVVSVVWDIARFVGLLPFHQKKDDQSFSFKWFSFTTLFSFTRLVIFNSPFTTLPIILFLSFGRNEWEEEQFEALLGIGNGTMSMSPTVETVLRVDYITSFSFYILSELQKS